ncbi:MAG: hypothetical protein NC899_09105 [Candidatus Omnitrophica bacterium]|nr:hypothetical protein [Candidatus Omnitrophota bacterium]
MRNLCFYCKKINSCLDAVNYENNTLIANLNKGIKVSILVYECPEFEIQENIEKEVEHICLSCIHKDSCSLWEQVCNIDEDFIKSAFDYDSELQSVCSTVSYCKNYKPTNNRREK